MLAETFVRSGKVRDLYAVDDERLLLVASDRLSAFDVVLPTPITDKGRVLTGLSRFWFDRTRPIVPNHLLSTDPADLPAGFLGESAEALRGRMLLCRRATVLPIEIVVRGYLSGSGWKEYRTTGSVCGVRLPSGLRESDRLPDPILTPATKAEEGHDENIDRGRMVAEIARVAGADAPRIADEVEAVALDLFAFGSAACAGAGIILADTKYEMGLADGSLILLEIAIEARSGDPLECLDIAPPRAGDDVGGQLGPGSRLVPQLGLQPVADELLVEARLGATGLIGRRVPEARRIRRHDLVDQDQFLWRAREPVPR